MRNIDSLPFPCAVTIAGSDSCGGAGIQADLKAFQALGVHGATVLSSLTAQNTTGVSAIHPVPADFVAAQLRAVLEDLPVAAIKTGMLPSARAIAAIAGILAECPRSIPLVIDPVLVATSGATLAGDAAMQAIEEHLFPLAHLVTPNCEEARAFTGLQISSPQDLERAASAFIDRGCAAVLLKGGHATGDADTVTDLLVTRRGRRTFTHALQPGTFHGTGCTLSAAVAAGLARGLELETAVRNAIRFVQDAMRFAHRPLRGQIKLLGLPA